MGIINLTKEEFLSLKRPITNELDAPTGIGGSIKLYNKDDGRTVVLSIYHDWETNWKKHKRIMKEVYKKIDYFTKLDDIDVAVLAREIVFIDQVFAGFSMRYLKNLFHLLYAIINEVDIHYCDLKYIIEVIKKLQNGVRYELHNRQIYITDFSARNVVFSNNKIHLIDTKEYKIKSFQPKGFDYALAIQNDVRSIIRVLMTLIMKRYVYQGGMLELMPSINLDAEILNYFFSFFKNNESPRYIDESILDEIGNNYIMAPNDDKKYEEIKFVLTKK